MLRIAMLIVCCLAAASALADVKNVADVSFAVPDGWKYTAGTEVGAMVVKADTRFWRLVVYSPMPSSGDANADFKAAWKRVVLAGPDYKSIPQYNPYDLGQTVGYPGKYYDAPSIDQKSYTRLYVLETGKSCIPVAFISQNRDVLGGMEHMARAVVGSVRLAPLQASPIKTTITVADLAGRWNTALVNSLNFYSNSGQYQTNSLTAIRSAYTVAPNGSYTYKYGGMVNNRMTNDDDVGVVQLEGEFVTFKGQRHVNRYRFVNLQQTLDGTSVLTLWPPVDLSKISTSDSMYWTRTR